MSLRQILSPLESPLQSVLRPSPAILQEESEIVPGPEPPVCSPCGCGGKAAFLVLRSLCGGTGAGEMGCVNGQT